MSALLYLFRHGHIEARGRMVGRADIPLSGQGEAQADYWRERLAGSVFDAAWTSPLRRALQTAERILAGNPANPAIADVVPGLAEISLGAWEGMTKGEVIARYPALWEARGADMLGTAPPGGESFADLARRVLPVFAALCREAAMHRRSLLVAHQAVNRVFLAHTLGLPPDRAISLPQPPACLSVLELGKRVRVVEEHAPFA